MKLTYSQKRYIQQNYHKETIEYIAKKKNISIDLIRKHIVLNESKFDSTDNKQTKIEPFVIKEHIPNLILLTFFVLLVYVNGFGAKFVSDDVYAILRNEAQLKSQNYLFITPTFILRSLQYLIAYKIGGLTPFFFRLWNIVFHIGFVWMTYMIVHVFSKKKFLPFFVASFAAVHPMMIESVTWISGGIYAQAGFSILVSFYFYLRYRTQYLLRYIIFALIAFICALSSSEKVIVFPFIIGLYEFTFGSLKKSWLQISSFFGISFIWGLILITRISERLEYIAVSQGDTTKLNIENPFFLIPSALGTYIKLFIWPRHLTLYQSEFQFSWWKFIILFTITLLFLAIIVWSYRKNKPVFFWLSFFVITLLPTLNPFGLSWIVAERYAYLGSVGLYFAFSVLLYQLIDNKKLHKLGYVIFAVLLMSFSVRTIVRNIDWQNEDNLWIATAKASPSDPKTHNNLGDMYARQGNLQKAAEAFSEAIRLNPRYPDATHNLANIFRQSGQTEQAEKFYLKAIELNPSLWQSYQNIAAINFEKGNFDKAEKYTLESMKILPNNSDLYMNLGLVYMNNGKKDFAIQAFQKALEINPENINAKRVLQEIQK